MSGSTIPGYSLEFYQSTNAHNVRIRLKDAQGAFDWQADVLAADWAALIAAVTGAAGADQTTYVIPNSSYASTIKYAGAIAPNDLTT